MGWEHIKHNHRKVTNPELVVSEEANIRVDNPRDKEKRGLST